MHRTLLILFVALILGCSKSEPNGSGVAGYSSSERNYQETGDLGALQQRGVLRVLFHQGDTEFSPRHDSPLLREHASLERFAKHQGMTLRLIGLESFDSLVPALIAGEGDIIASNLAQTEQHKQQLQFTYPVAHSRVSLLRNAKLPESKKLQVQRGTRFWSIAEEYARDNALTLTTLPKQLTSGDILEAVNDGTIPLTLGDSNQIKIAKSYLPNLKAKAISDEQVIAWGVRKNNPQLLTALNHWITQEKLQQPLTPVSTEDLAAIKKRGTLRVLLLNEITSYFLFRGELLGFEYEVLKEFARRHNLALSVKVVHHHDQLLPLLKQGEGDIAAAFFTPTAERKALGIAFSRRYHQAREVLVSRSGDHISKLSELHGKSLHIRPSSSYWQSAQELIEQGIDIRLVAVDENVSTTDIIEGIGDGRYAYTIADEHLLELVQTWRDDVHSQLAITPPADHGWAVRDQNPELLAAVNAFHRGFYRSTKYNLLYKKYFENKKRIQLHSESHNSDQVQLSPYDKLVKPLAKQAGVDWRLITAQMYQESRFNPKAVSWAGARGLMQLMPAAAKQMGYNAIDKPEDGIAAGIAYLNWVGNRLPEHLPESERKWFALAAYNAGLSHVKDARRLAAQLQLNPDRWFGHVETAMLLLSKPQYYRKARFGFVRGIEPVRYVRDIRERYRAYVAITDIRALAEKDS